MHIFLGGIPLDFSLIFSLVEFYFTWIALSPTLIKYFCLLILIVHSIIPYWLWEASHLHIYYIRSPLLLILIYKYKEIHIYMVIATHTLCYCCVAGLESNFWRSLNTKACYGELLSSSLLLSLHPWISSSSSIHAFPY